MAADKKWMALNNPSQSIQKTALMLKEKSQTFFDGTTMLVGMKHCGAFFNSFVFHHKKSSGHLSSRLHFSAFLSLIFWEKRIGVRSNLFWRPRHYEQDWMGAKQKTEKGPKEFFFFAIIDQKQCRPENGRETWTFWKNGLDGWDVELENGEMVSEEACNQMLFYVHGVHSAREDRVSTSYLSRINTRDIWMFLCPLWYMKTMTRS